MNVHCKIKISALGALGARYSVLERGRMDSASQMFAFSCFGV